MSIKSGSVDFSEAINDSNPFFPENFSDSIESIALIDHFPSPLKFLVILNEIRKREQGVGYSLITGEYLDMKKAGIIDPVKVTRSALQNAASVAGMVITTEGLITSLPEKEEKAAMPSGMGDY